MFNFGWGEIVLIGIVALIAIGPKELPTVLRSVGQMMAKVRRMAAEFQGQFQEALREAEIADLKKQAEDLTSTVKDKVTDFTKFDPLAETKSDIEKAFDAPAGAPQGGHAAGQIHLRQQPAAENVTVGVCVRRHGDGAQGRPPVHVRVGRIVVGARAVAHRSSRRRFSRGLPESKNHLTKYGAESI